MRQTFFFSFFLQIIVVTITNNTTVFSYFIHTSIFRMGRHF